MAVAYLLDSQFLEKSKNNEIESTGYTEFTTFTNEKFGHEESVELFAELVNFCNKNSPYDNEIIWESINILNHFYGNNYGHIVNFNNWTYKFFNSYIFCSYKKKF